MRVPNKIIEVSINQALKFFEKNPEKNLPKIMDWVDRFAGGTFAPQREAVRHAIEHEDNPYHSYILRLASEIDEGVLQRIFVNFVLNANLIGWPKQEEARKKYECNIPWLILLDPTSACNLQCTGCWAAEYGNKLNLSLEEIDDIVKQGKELGIYFYIYTGGEPLVRKKDLIEICDRHPDCVFLAFTNGTLIDEDFTNEMLRVKNFVPALSVEGFEEVTDERRGRGVFKKVIEAMRLMRSKRLPFGTSCCYTQANFDSISSEEFYDMMIDEGAFFVWFFHYMPVGNNASTDLLPTPEQRTEMIRRIRDYRVRKPLFAIDFQNDGEYIDGCIAAGRRYLHINANGDVDPCVFIHYSDSNIREKSLLDTLQSPLFMAYYEGQPFNENMLRPCPMLENPEILREIVARTGAHSTDLESLESADHLCSKCDQYAKNWAPVADALWQNKQNL